MTPGQKKTAATAARIVIAYVVSSIVYAILFFELGGGHADVPFTMFPDYLVVSPVLPVFALFDIPSQPGAREILSIVAFMLTFVVIWLGTGSLRPRSRRNEPREGRP